MHWLMQKLTQWLTRWLTRERDRADIPLIDFKRLAKEVKPGDVILVEGISRVSGIIQAVTLSSWSHAALYAGRLADLAADPATLNLDEDYEYKPDTQVLIEAELGYGTVVAPLHKYQQRHLRICRPSGLAPAKRLQAIANMQVHLGRPYDLLQIFDLLRYLFPYHILPRRWRSGLFQFQTGEYTRTVCSSAVAEAFSALRYPILPVIQQHESGQGLVFKQRNFRLATPRDFDYSPYFDIIKYPVLGGVDMSVYEELPWDSSGVVCNTPDVCFANQQTEREGQSAEDQTNSA